jgi:hypothetical protein
MSAPSENENWLIEEGHAIIVKEAERGQDSLSPIERLIRYWWIADYGMNNAGDLDVSLDMDGSVLDEGLRLASELRLPLTREAFASGKATLETTYFERFEAVCDELRKAYGR